MNKVILLAISVLAFFMTSCSDVNNEVWINKDGSGKFEVSMDMGEMLGMIEMMSAMSEKEENTEPVENNDDEEATEEDVLNLLGSFSSPDNVKNIDTAFVVYDVMPDSLKNIVDNTELLKKVNFAIKVNKEESEMFFKMGFEYDNPEERDQLVDLFSEFSEMDAEDKANLSQFKDMMRQYDDADLESGIVTLPEQDFSTEFAEEMGEDDMDFDNMSEEDLGMMKMMLGDAGYVTTIHLPDEIISCDDDEAKIYGKTIILKDSYMDLMKNKKMKGRIIKFKVD